MTMIPNAVATMMKTAPDGLDLTEKAHLQQLRDFAEILLNTYPNLPELKAFEKYLLQDKEAVPLLLHLAIKLAISKRVVASVKDDVHVSVVFAVYAEHNRILAKEEHPHGENFLIRKIDQMQWLFDPFPNFTWDLVVVDDGDPNKSGEIAQKILNEKYSEDNVQVLFLDDAIVQQLSVVQPMTDASQSRKGGSIQYGMWTAVQQEYSNHIVVFTDADLSTHLGQIGLLVDGIINQGKDAAIGSRREPSSVVIKTGARNLRGKLFIYLWKRIIPNLGYIVDTQCGFKAFRAETVSAIIDNLIEKKFAFDIELLLKTELNRSNSIAKIPIAWIDSEAASTTTAIQPYLAMLQAIAQMYRQYLPSSPTPESFATFVESLDEVTWNQLLQNIPSAITQRQPYEFADFQAVTVADLQNN